METCLDLNSRNDWNSFPLPRPDSVHDIKANSEGEIKPRQRMVAVEHDQIFREFRDHHHPAAATVEFDGEFLPDPYFISCWKSGPFQGEEVLFQAWSVGFGRRNDHVANLADLHCGYRVLQRREDITGSHGENKWLVVGSTVEDPAVIESSDVVHGHQAARLYLRHLNVLLVCRGFPYYRTGHSNNPASR